MLRHGSRISKHFPGRVRRAVGCLPVRSNSQLIATDAANASTPSDIPPPPINTEETEGVANTGVLNEKAKYRDVGPAKSYARKFRLTLGYRPLLNRPSGLPSPSFEITPGVTSATNHTRKWLEEGSRTRLLFVNEPSTAIAFKYPKTMDELPSVKKALQEYPGFALVTHEKARSMLLVRFHDIRSAIRAMTRLRKENPFPGVDYFYKHAPPSPILSIQLVPCDAGEGLGHLIQSLTQNSSHYTYDYHVTPTKAALQLFITFHRVEDAFKALHQLAWNVDPLIARMHEFSVTLMNKTSTPASRKAFMRRHPITREEWLTLYKGVSDSEMMEAWRTATTSYHSMGHENTFRAQVILNLLLTNPEKRQYAVAALVRLLPSLGNMALVTRLDELRKAKANGELVIKNPITEHRPIQYPPPPATPSASAQHLSVGEMMNMYPPEDTVDAIMKQLRLDNPSRSSKHKKRSKSMYITTAMDRDPTSSNWGSQSKRRETMSPRRSDPKRSTVPRPSHYNDLPLDVLPTVHTNGSKSSTESGFVASKAKMPWDDLYDKTKRVMDSISAQDEQKPLPEQQRQFGGQTVKEPYVLDTPPINDGAPTK